MSYVENRQLQSPIAGALRSRGSISGWLIASSGISALITFLLAGIFLYHTLEQIVSRHYEEIMRAKLASLSRLIAMPNADATMVRHELDRDDGEPKHVHVHLYGDIQTENDKSKGHPEDLEKGFFPAPVGEPTEEISLNSFYSKDGRHYQTMSAWLPLGAVGNEARIYARLARDVSEGDKILSRFAAALIAGLAVLFGVTAAIAAVVIKEPFAQLRKFENTVAEISTANLDRRFEIDGLPSELQTLGQSFNEMLSRVQESHSRLSNFSANIAHELKSPLNNMLLAIDVALRKARTVEEYRAVLESFAEDGERLSRLVQDLLLVARGKSLDADLERQQIDVASEIEIIREYFAPAAQEREITLKVSHNVSRPINANRILLQRAINNLVDNALKYTPSGGTINLSAVELDRSTKIEVNDTGEGISPEFLPYAFDRFTVGAPSVAAHNGTGLGLSIVRSVVELHGGSVRIESERGKGTVVTIEIPHGNATPQNVVI
jgi:two-component system heavy metal sensor histidine kinase CusS